MPSLVFHQAVRATGLEVADIFRQAGQPAAGNTQTVSDASDVRWLK